MSDSKKGGCINQLTVLIQGHEVTLYFAEQPNSRVSSQVKQALLGIYLLAEK